MFYKIYLLLRYDTFPENADHDVKVDYDVTSCEVLTSDFLHITQISQINRVSLTYMLYDISTGNSIWISEE